MKDPVFELARRRVQRLVEDSAAIELEFDNIRAWRPVLTIMKRLRDQAADALTALAVADPEDPKLIRLLQNKVNLFADFVSKAREVYVEGIEAGDLLDAEEKEEMRDLAFSPPEGEQHEDQVDDD
jgi:hypothetical protein